MYVEIFRNIPLLVQMFFWYFVLPEIRARHVSAWRSSRWSRPGAAFVPALICLGLFTSARIAEQVRAGCAGAAARAGAGAPTRSASTKRTMYRVILLPQAFRIILPTLTNEFMTIFKNTSVALTIGLVELTATAREINENTFRTFEAFGVVTIIYLLIALVAWQIMHRIEQASRVAEPRHRKGAVIQVRRFRADLGLCRS